MPAPVRPLRSDLLPDSIEECDRELTSAAETLPHISKRSRELTLRRADRLLDRRLLLTQARKRKPSRAKKPFTLDSK